MNQLFHRMKAPPIFGILRISEWRSGAAIQGPVSRRRVRTLAAIAPVLLLIFGVLAAAPDAWGQGAATPEEKIRADIFHHQKLKQRPPGRALAEHRRRVEAAGINAADLDREEIVIYVTDRLTRAEIVAWRGRGIEIDPDLWVPPVPGQHPLGYHLGRARYESLILLARDKRVVRLDSAEAQNHPQNDVGGTLINVDAVHAGTGLNGARNGAGIRIAIADSGADLTHPDLSVPAEAFDVTDGVGLANWGTNVANTLQNHGTHVTGTVVGNGGLSGGLYQGGAPGATWAFYKVGNDTTSGGAAADEIEAINRAAALGYDIFTMSYGGLTDFFMDGSGATEQAIDSAVAGGMTVFISAGNSAARAKHASLNVTPQTTAASFGFTISNAGGMGALTTPVTVQVIWRDSPAGNTNVALTCNNLAAGESLNLVATNTSSRGTDARQYSLTPNIAAAGQKSYTLVLSNSAPAGGGAPLVHLYASGAGTHATPDPSFTVGSPAIADGAIAVGAWVQRANWTDFTGAGGQNFGETANGLASFSSHGPRIDGRLKPDLLAPGSGTISLLDANDGSFSTTATTAPVPATDIIDNDGLNLNGSGPANYAVLQGTSMACPMAAAVAALVLQQNPNLTPAQLRNILTLTASSAGYPDNLVGYGLIDALAAVREAETPSVWVAFSYVGVELGTFTQPYNTFAEGVAAVPVRSASFPYLPRLRIKSGSTPGAFTLSKFMQVESFAGAVSLGQ